MHTLTLEILFIFLLGPGGGIMHSAFSYLYLHDGILKLQYSCEDIAAQT